MSIYSCAEDLTQPCSEGNHVIWSLNPPPVNATMIPYEMNITQVFTEYCEDKKERCSCIGLLADLFHNAEGNFRVERISVPFLPLWDSRVGFLERCKCILEAAFMSTANFRWIELQQHGKKDKCSVKTKFDETNYEQVCQNYKRMKCDKTFPKKNDPYAHGLITKQ